MPRFRAKQILEWVYEKGVADPDSMSNLSKADRDKLRAGFAFLSGPTVRHEKASDGTQKLLIRWDDAAAAKPEAPAEPSADISLSQVGASDPSRETECVMIPSFVRSEEADDDGEEVDGAGSRARRSGLPRFTACVSSQVGCPVGCRFCASGIGGFDGNLSAGRIVEQAWRLARLEGVRRITNVVFMGMGEPLSNFANVTRAIRTMSALWGMGISARKITVSTVGLPKYIERLATEFDVPVTLALSLHAPTDELRRQLIPWAEYTTIAELLASCQKWFAKTGREVTLEYTLLHNVNDRQEHARQLADLARSLRANVNLIRYNEVKGVPFRRPLDADVLAFQAVLRAKGINTHIRASRGRDIAAACGQLRHEAAASA